jgi:hypothetical protein
LLPRSGVPPSLFGHRNFSYFALRNSPQKKRHLKKLLTLLALASMI